MLCCSLHPWVVAERQVGAESEVAQGLATNDDRVAVEFGVLDQLAGDARLPGCLGEATEYAEQPVRAGGCERLPDNDFLSRVA